MAVAYKYETRLRRTKIAICKGSLAPLLRNANHTYINLSLASPVPQFELTLHPNSLTFARFSTVLSPFNTKGFDCTRTSK